MMSLTKYQSVVKLGDAGSKRRSLGQIIEKNVNVGKGHILALLGSNLLRMISLTKSRTSLKLGHVELKIRSLGRIIEKPCEHS